MNGKTPEYFNQKQLENLSKDPKNRVYTYVNDNPTAKFTIDEQKNYIIQIRNQYIKAREIDPKLSDNNIRSEIRKNKNFDLFAENNGRIFDTLTSRTSTTEHINHIRYMLYIKEQQERGFVDDATAQNMIQDYLITAFKTNMSPEEYKAQLKSTDQKKQK